MVCGSALGGLDPWATFPIEYEIWFLAQIITQNNIKDQIHDLRGTNYGLNSKLQGSKYQCLVKNKSTGINPRFVYDRWSRSIVDHVGPLIYKMPPWSRPLCCWLLWCWLSWCWLCRSLHVKPWFFWSQMSQRQKSEFKTPNNATVIC